MIMEKICVQISFAKIWIFEARTTVKMPQHQIPCNSFFAMWYFFGKFVVFTRKNYVKNFLRIVERLGAKCNTLIRFWK